MHILHRQRKEEGYWHDGFHTMPPCHSQILRQTEEMPNQRAPPEKLWAPSRAVCTRSINTCQSSWTCSSPHESLYLPTNLTKMRHTDMRHTTCGILTCGIPLTDMRLTDMRHTDMGLLYSICKRLRLRHSHTFMNTQIKKSY